MYEQVIRVKTKLREHRALYGQVQKAYHCYMRGLKLAGYTFRHFMILPEKKLVYLVNYKAASSSILASMMDVDIQSEARIHQMARQYFIGRTSLKAEEKDYFSFTFVRNPFTRLLSCYKDKVEGEREEPRPYFTQNLFGRLAASPSFEDFALAVGKIPDRIADVHFVSQHYFIYRKGQPVVDHVGRMESIGTEYEEIRSRFGLKPLANYNQTDSDRWMEAYSPAAAEAVFRRYAKDIEAFGYMDDYRRLIRYLEEKEGG